MKSKAKRTKSIRLSLDAIKWLEDEAQRTHRTFSAVISLLIGEARKGKSDET